MQRDTFQQRSVGHFYFTDALFIAYVVLTAGTSRKNPLFSIGAQKRIDVILNTQRQTHLKNRLNAEGLSANICIILSRVAECGLVR